MIRYLAAPGAAWANSSARISQIEDVRATAQGGSYYTYAFTYNNDSPRHLTSITNTISTGENYSFSYILGQSLLSPFNSQSYGVAAQLQTATVTNVGTSHQFAYATSGEITRIQLPYQASPGHYGYMAYDYGSTAYQSNSTTYREIRDRYISPDGTSASQLAYNFSHESNSPSGYVHQYTVVSDASGNSDKLYYFWQSGAALGLVSTYYGRQEPGWALRDEVVPGWVQDAVGNSYIAATQTVLDPGQPSQAVKQTNQTVDIYGNVTQVVYYNWNNLSTPMRTDNFTYLNSSAYTSQYIFNRLTSSPTTTISYDGAGLSSVSGLREWDSNVQNVTARGNPTTITGPDGTTTFTYNVAGAPASMTVNGVMVAVTTNGSTNYAAPSQLTTGSLTQTMSYNSFLGTTSTTGPNNASVSIGYDANARPTSVTSPFGAVTTTTYNDTASPATILTSVNGRWTRQTLDGLGRTILTETGTGSTTISQAETVYGPVAADPMGKVLKQAVPHAPGATPAWTVYGYDPLGRTLSVVAPDGASTTTYSYSANTATSTDPAGKWKKFTMDGVGNLAQVNEPNPAGGADYVTNYTYDILGHVTSVYMPRPTGTQTRSFSYSGNLLTSAINPESNTTSYSVGNGRINGRIDGKNQQDIYAYDPYGRLSLVYHQLVANYGGYCGVDSYYYDTNPFDSTYSQNALGRLTAVLYGGAGCYGGGGNFVEMYSYNSGGAVIG
ncbi:MAG: hypothetical protein JO307_16545, partial [Bryobacterales bacterium]|nr:hypothetical protein [Bryobacterales bacterium]